MWLLSPKKTHSLDKNDHDLTVTPTEPHPGEEEVLAKIHAAALNPADWKFHKQGFRFPMYTTPETSRIPLTLSTRKCAKCVAASLLCPNNHTKDGRCLGQKRKKSISAGLGGHQTYALEQRVRQCHRTSRRVERSRRASSLSTPTNSSH